MNKKLLAGLAAGVLMFGMVGKAEATLIGDTVMLRKEATGYGVTEILTTVVTADATDAMWLFPPIAYSVNVGSDNIFVYYETDTAWRGDLLFNGIVIDDLNDSSGNGLQSVSIDTNKSGWNSGMLSFDDDTVWLNFIGGTTARSHAGDYYNITLDFGTTPVPEPATILLFGTGLAGLTASRLRRKKKNGVPEDSLLN